MEPHPIPQNVTSFQFKLVGDMTLKQFLYLAGGVGLAYFLFVFLASSYPVVAWPLIVISALCGVALAFLPLASRPLDDWVATFLKAIYSPTKRSWQKGGKDYKQNPLFNSRYVMYLSSLPASTPGEQPAQLQQQPISPAAIQTPAEAVAQLPTPEELAKTVDLAKEAQSLQVRIIQAERALNQIRKEADRPSPIPIDYSLQVNQILSDLQNLVAQASQIKQQLDVITHQRETIKAEASIMTAPRGKIKVVIPVKPKQQQLALTTFPNVINGVVNDSTGNYLEGVIAVIYDQEGLPVRALKTNKLGQFSGATPLPNGVYNLELEKESFIFDVLQIELDGQVLPPLVIGAKRVI